MTAQFHGRVALVTGAAAGIGEACARLLAQRGATVIVADLNADGERTTAAIRADGGQAEFIQTDVTRADQVERLIAAIVERHGRLDAAVNNAGIEHESKLLADLSEDEWDRTEAVNVKGVWLCLKYEIRQMLTQGGGAIVNIASVAGLVGAARLGGYAASKHGVVGLTRSAAAEYARNGIRVNAVCPGIIRTAMFQRFLDRDPSLAERAQRSNPARRLGEPHEIAEAVAWLLSDAAGFVHGHALAVDGGLTAV